MPPAVGGITPPPDQALLLELVEQPDEPAPVVAERLLGVARVRRRRLAAPKKPQPGCFRFVETERLQPGCIESS